MEKLNEEIRKKEIEVLNSELKLNISRTEYEIAVLKESFILEKQYSETKEKELSTIQKREKIASRKEDIKTMKEEIDKNDLLIKLERIELRYMDRKFKIMLN